MSKQLRIVCAAIRAEDGSVITGIRHYSGDMHSQIMSRNDGDKFCHRNGDDQGFVDQRGGYHTRKQAWIIAEKAGQLLYRHDADNNDTLYSENLY